MIDVIIVNWNAGRQLMSCVKSVQDYGQGLVAKVIVVDNGSTDGSDTLIDGMNGVTLVRAGENLGFGRACNLGAGYSSSPYILFLNPDAALMEEGLQTVVSFMEAPENSKVGICGVQLIDEGGHIARSCSQKRTVANMAVHAMGLDRLVPSWGPAMKTWTHNENCFVDQVIGAFYMVRRDMFRSLGGFDERFFVYYEEVDFAHRAQLAGWASYYLADFQVFHEGGGTSVNVKAHRLFYSTRSRLQFVKKCLPFAGFVIVALATFLIEPLARSGQAIARRSLADLRNIWTAYLWLIMWILSGAKGGR